MSDPVTNVEIEDVLSSIRKLVSVDDRPEKTAETSMDAGAERLVLTPSLRVDDSAESAQADDSADAPEAGDTAQDLSENEAPEPDVFDAGSARDEATPSDEETDDADNIGEASEQDPGLAPEAEPARLSEEHAEPEEAPVAITARAAIFQKAATTIDDQWEPDGTSENENAAAPTKAQPWQDDDVEEAEEAEEAPASRHNASETEGLEPFTPEEDDADDAEFYVEETASEPVEALQGNAFLSEDDTLDDADTILDEETLRDLVAEIVRQELQGSLGERITRNVRKLVRREIQRALAAQELE